MKPVKKYQHPPYGSHGSPFGSRSDGFSRSFRFDNNGNFGQTTDFSDIFSELFGAATEDPFAGQRGSQVVGRSTSPVIRIAGLIVLGIDF